MRVNVIGNANGVGLSRDLEIVSRVLLSCGCDVEVTALDPQESQRRRSRLMQLGVQWRAAWRNGRRRQHDLNVMLEHVWTQFLNAGRCNVCVPNPEWFDRHDVRFLGRLDYVWAKTANTQRIFAGYGRKIAQIGFDSEDRHDPGIAREPVFFHLAGSSTMKGSARVLALWRDHPEWPRLIVVQHAGDDSERTAAANIEIRSDYMDDAALKTLQNRCRFHLCTSEAEGWGHYLAEAMSVGAVTIAVDAPPMNELVTLDRGLLVSYRDTRPQKLAERYLFDERSLEKAVQRATAMPAAELESIGSVARAWFLRNKAEFGARIAQALQKLSPLPRSPGQC